MNKENCSLKLVDEIILYYDARSEKTSKRDVCCYVCCICCYLCLSVEEAKYNTTFSEPCNKTGERDSNHAMSVSTDGLKR